MALPDLEELLAPVSAEAPCGADLEYDAAFLELEQAARGKAEQAMGDAVIAAEEPDWRDVGTRAQALFARTKDLRVGVHLTRAWLDLHGLPGFAQGLALIHQLLERFWDGVHPPLDADDDNDPTLRLNALLSLADADGLLGAVRRAPLISSRRVGVFSLQGAARGQSGAAGAPDAATLGAAWQDSAPEARAATATAIGDARTTLRAMEAFLAQQVGAAQVPDFAPLARTLREADLLLAAVSGGATTQAPSGAPEVSSSDAAAPVSAGAGGNGSGPIRSPADVASALDRICEYYARHEPSSPLPVLLRRARRLVGKDFVAIIGDLAPDAMAQIDTLRGAQADSE